jgi:hypothetical protein
VKQFLGRYRWWLILACLAAGVIGWWQLSARAGGRYTRAQYDRIRLGMTPAEVASVIGCPSANYTDGLWDIVADAGGPLFFGQADRYEVWVDEPVRIVVCYRDGKTIANSMQTRVPPWKVKAREWLRWLRGLVGLWVT